MDNPTIFSDGTMVWHNNELKRHREDGPAVTFINGCEQWYIDGKRHRKGGPAVVFPNGDRDWYIHGTLHYNNKSYQEAAGLSDEEMTMIILKYGNIS
jgi:hypothetical protein